MRFALPGECHAAVIQRREHDRASGIDRRRCAATRCAALGLADRSDPLTEIIAKKIIERAQTGELDAVRLCEDVLDELRGEC